MPLSPGLNDDSTMREKYFKIMIKRLEKYCGQDILKHIEFKRSYCIEDFEQDYNAFKGNAYGLANTLMQTANLKPKIINKKISNLFYTGQLTVPGPGVPPSIISGQVVADYISKKLFKMKSIFDNVSYACSKYTTKMYSTSFSMGIKALNKELHKPIYNIYGFVRLADEIVDTFHDYNNLNYLNDSRKMTRLMQSKRKLA